MAEEWGVPPWVVENDCSEKWFDWWLIVRNEKAAIQKAEQDKIKRR